MKLFDCAEREGVALENIGLGGEGDGVIGLGDSGSVLQIEGSGSLRIDFDLGLRSVLSRHAEGDEQSQSES